MRAADPGGSAQRVISYNAMSTADFERTRNADTIRAMAAKITTLQGAQRQPAQEPPAGRRCRNRNRAVPCPPREWHAAGAIPVRLVNSPDTRLLSRISRRPASPAGGVFGTTSSALGDRSVVFRLSGSGASLPSKLIWRACDLMMHRAHLPVSARQPPHHQTVPSRPARPPRSPVFACQRRLPPPPTHAAAQVLLSYRAIGSGAGLSEFAGPNNGFAPWTHFGASDSVLPSTCAAPGGAPCVSHGALRARFGDQAVLTLPIAVGMVGVFHTVPAASAPPGARLNLTANVVCQIYSGCAPGGGRVPGEKNPGEGRQEQPQPAAGLCRFPAVLGSGNASADGAAPPCCPAAGRRCCVSLLLLPPSSITTWDHASIKVLNPELRAVPANQPITVVVRADSSGSTRVRRRCHRQAPAAYRANDTSIPRCARGGPASASVAPQPSTRRRRCSRRGWRPPAAGSSTPRPGPSCSGPPGSTPWRAWGPRASPRSCRRCRERRAGRQPPAPRPLLSVSCGAASPHAPRPPPPSQALGQETAFSNPWAIAYVDSGFGKDAGLVEAALELRAGTGVFAASTALGVAGLLAPAGGYPASSFADWATNDPQPRLFNQWQARRRSPSSQTAQPPPPKPWGDHRLAAVVRCCATALLPPCVPLPGRRLASPPNHQPPGRLRAPGLPNHLLLLCLPPRGPLAPRRGRPPRRRARPLPPLRGRWCGGGQGEPRQPRSSRVAAVL